MPAECIGFVERHSAVRSAGYVPTHGAGTDAIVDCSRQIAQVVEQLRPVLFATAGRHRRRRYSGGENYRKSHYTPLSGRRKVGHGWSCTSPVSSMRLFRNRTNNSIKPAVCETRLKGRKYRTYNSLFSKSKSCGENDGTKYNSKYSTTCEKVFKSVQNRFAKRLIESTLL